MSGRDHCLARLRGDHVTGNRRDARILAVRALYQMHVGRVDVDTARTEALRNASKSVVEPIESACSSATGRVRTRFGDILKDGAFSLRRASAMRRAVIAVLEQFSANLIETSRQCIAACGQPPYDPAIADTDGTPSGHRDLELAEARARDTRARYADLPEIADTMVDETCLGARSISDVFGRHLSDACSVGAYAARLTSGVVASISAVDAQLDAFTIHWQKERQALVDRIIMQTAIYEILFVDDVPPPVAINEAIELARIYSTDDSPRFINGVLGALADKLKEQHTV